MNIKLITKSDKSLLLRLQIPTLKYEEFINQADTIIALLKSIQSSRKNLINYVNYSETY